MYVPVTTRNRMCSSQRYRNHHHNPNSNMPGKGFHLLIIQLLCAHRITVYTSGIFINHGLRSNMLLLLVLYTSIIDIRLQPLDASNVTHSGTLNSDSSLSSMKSEDTKCLLKRHKRGMLTFNKAISFHFEPVSHNLTGKN